MKRTKNKGFTLIELVVVMGVMAILLALAIPSYLNYSDKAKTVAIQQDMRIVRDAHIMLEAEGGTVTDGVATIPANGLNHELASYNVAKSGNEITVTTTKEVGGAVVPYPTIENP